MVEVAAVAVEFPVECICGHSVDLVEPNCSTVEGVAKVC